MASTLSVTPIKSAAEFQTWMAQIPVNLSLSTVDMICKAELYRGTYSFSTSLHFTGITSTASQHVWVAAAPGHEHGGVPGAGPLLTWTAIGGSTHAFKISINHMLVDDLEMTWSGGTSTTGQLRLARIDGPSGDWSAYRRCMVHDFRHNSLATTANVGMSIQAGAAYNCAVWNIGYPQGDAANSRGISAGNSATSGQVNRIVNCSAWNCCGALFQGTVTQSGATIEIINCYAAVGSITSAVCFRPESSAGSYLMMGNVSTDSSANTFGGVGARVDQPNVGTIFSDITALGLRLASDNTSAVSAGSNLYSSYITSRKDIAGYERYVTGERVDSGAYQLQSPRASRSPMGKNSSLRHDLRG